MATSIIHLIIEEVRNKFIELKDPIPGKPLRIKTVAGRLENPLNVKPDRMPIVFFGYGSTRPTGGVDALVGEDLARFSVFCYIVCRAETDAEARTRLGLTQEALLEWQCGDQETLDDCYTRLQSELPSGSLPADKAAALDKIREHQIKDVLTVAADIQKMMYEMAIELSTFDISTELDFTSDDAVETYDRCQVGDVSTGEGKFTDREFLQVRFDFRIGYF